MWRTWGVKCPNCENVALIHTKRAFQQDQPEEPNFCPHCGYLVTFKELVAMPKDPTGEGRF